MAPPVPCEMMTVLVMDDPDVTAAEQKVNKWSLSSQSVFEKSNCRNRLLQPAFAALQHARVVSGGQERTQMDTQPSVPCTHMVFRLPQYAVSDAVHDAPVVGDDPSPGTNTQRLQAVPQPVDAGQFELVFVATKGGM